MSDRVQLIDDATDEESELDPEIVSAHESYAMRHLPSSRARDERLEMDDVSTLISSPVHDDRGVFRSNASTPETRPVTPTADANGTKKQYKDFSTIDWARDAANDWKRQKALQDRKHRLSVFPKKIHWHSRYASIWDASQGWIVITLIGLFAGLIAGILNICITWLNDIKLGYCDKAFFLTQEQCCWAESYLGEPDCEAWITWAVAAGATNATGADNVANPHLPGAYAVDFFFYLLFASLFSLTSAFFVKRLAPYAAGSGLAEIKVILGGFIIRGYFGFWTLVVKSLGIVLALSSGLNLGNEGPMVHISLCLGNVFTRIFKKFNTNEGKRREILSAAAAIGVAAAFNAPIGGVLYSLEEVSYYFPHKTMWRSFFGCLVAALTLSYMNPLSYREGTFTDRAWHWFEAPAFLLLGVFGGLFGAGFCYFNVKYCGFRKKSILNKYPITEVVVTAILTGVLGFPNQFATLTGHGLLDELFKDCEPQQNSLLCTGSAGGVAGILIGTLIFKMVTIVVTIGLKVPAGLLIPSLAIGAIAGRVVGIFMEQVTNHYRASSYIVATCPSFDGCVTPSLYAMVGATAALAGVSRMTVALVVIMFELTGALHSILPFMIAAAVAKWVADALHHEGIYDAHIHLNGFPYLDAKEEFEHYTRAVDVMQPQPGTGALICVAMREKIGDIEKLFHKGTPSVSGFPIVTSHQEMKIVGYISKRDLRAKLDSEIKGNKNYDTQTMCYFYDRSSEGANKESGPDFFDLVYNSPFEVPSSMPMVNVIELFRRMGMRFCLVTEKGSLVGIITKKDVLRHIADMNHRETVKLNTAQLAFS